MGLDHQREGVDLNVVYIRGVGWWTGCAVREGSDDAKTWLGPLGGWQCSWLTAGGLPGGNLRPEPGDPFQALLWTSQPLGVRAKGCVFSVFQGIN